MIYCFQQLVEELEKRSMARDVALSWRMGRFFKEVGNDSKAINTSVAVMVIFVLLVMA